MHSSRGLMLLLDNFKRYRYLGYVNKFTNDNKGYYNG